MGDLLRYRALLVELTETIDKIIALEVDGADSQDPRVLEQLGRMLLIQQKCKEL